MILESIKTIHISPEEIAEYFGLYLPHNEKTEIKKVFYTTNPFEFGTRIKDNELNQFFVDFNLPLIEEYKSISLFQDWEFYDKVLQELENGCHLICGFSYGILFGQSKMIDIGHASIITKVIDRNHFEILDPGPKEAGFKVVDYYKLYSAIRTKKDGVWIIKESNRGG
jgi:hypothetical protein